MACKSDVEREPWLTFFWDISNYSYCWQSKGEYFLSPSMGLVENASWRLMLFPRGSKENVYLSICGKCNDGSESITVERELALLTKDDLILHIKPRGKKKFVKKGNLENVFLKCDEIVTTINNFLFRDSLRIRFRLWRTDGKAMTPTTFFARTVLCVREINIDWNIERFTSLLPGEKVNFALSGESEDDKAALNIEVNEESQIVISINSFYESMKFLILQPFLINTDGLKIDCGRREMLQQELKENATCTLPFTQKYLMDNKNVYLKNDVLSLYLECSWCDGFDLNRIEKISIGNNKINHKLCRSHSDVEEPQKEADLKEDLINLYVEGTLSDVKLRTTFQTFHSHKAILSARSPVFRAMFTTDMKEKIQQCVDIPDLEDDTVLRMLFYMYTDDLEGLQWERAVKLYDAADKYLIATLKNKCSSFMKRNLCPSKACEVLGLADIHRDGNLKKAAQEYAVAHEEVVFNSDEWSEFAKNNSTLAADTMLRKWKRPTTA
ncbi:TD and POZ domain-containing protein 3 [Trichonephila inaurata madagascariensis]|uniref:TD and POZ domain-containing protein 3 n=1 Tax=Trichonephila inaurata madagascariensis TaxID=2747483 RepID=A0A8X7C403_9ARAC|nr:TD and POZ domain-containing protein 3 [Trichonephila inaurata madagascariensis]